MNLKLLFLFMIISSNISGQWVNNCDEMKVDSAVENKKIDLVFRMKKFQGARCEVTKERIEIAKEKHVIHEISELRQTKGFMDYVEFFEDVENDRWRQTEAGFSRAFIFKIETRFGDGVYYRFVDKGEKEMMIILKKEKGKSTIRGFGKCKFKNRALMRS